MNKKNNMERCIQFEITQPDPYGNFNILALSEDGRLFIRPSKQKDFPEDKWTEITFPPKEVNI